MKKIIVTLLLISTVTICQAQDQYYQSEQKEIKLNTNLPTKTYNLNKPIYKNDTKHNNTDDDDMLFNFKSTPLQLLKQYQEDKL